MREGFEIARCTVERLMARMGLCGFVRGRAWKRTTIADDSVTRPMDLVRRDCSANRPNRLSVADRTYVATWEDSVYVALVSDVFSRKTLGWKTPAEALDELLRPGYQDRVATTP